MNMSPFSHAALIFFNLCCKLIISAPVDNLTLSPTYVPTQYPSIPTLAVHVPTLAEAESRTDDVTTTQFLNENPNINEDNDTFNISDLLSSITIDLLIAAFGLFFLCFLCLIICCIRKTRISSKARKNPYTKTVKEMENEKGDMKQEKHPVKKSLAIVYEDEGMLLDTNGKVTIGGMDIIFPHSTPRPPPRRKKKKKKSEHKDEKDNDDDVIRYNVNDKLLLNSNMETPNVPIGNDNDDDVPPSGVCLNDSNGYVD